MRTGTDATGAEIITAAADFIHASLFAKNERVDDKARMRIERDVAGTLAWLLTTYRDESPELEALARSVLVGALELSRGEVDGSNVVQFRQRGGVA